MNTITRSPTSYNRITNINDITSPTICNNQDFDNNDKENIIDIKNQYLENFINSNGSNRMSSIGNLN